MGAEHYDSRIRDTAVLEWKAGASYGEIAKRFNIPRATVQHWCKGHSRTIQTQIAGRAYADAVAIAIETRAGDLIDAYFNALLGIAQLAGNSAWRERQDARDVALLEDNLWTHLARMVGGRRTPGAEFTDDAGEDGGDTNPRPLPAPAE